MQPGDEELPADDGALEKLLRDRRFGPLYPNEVTSWGFVRAWPDSALRTRVWPIISRLLIDDDERVRDCALEFARTWDQGAALTMPRLLEVAERQLDRFGDQKVEGLTLRHSLAFALASHVRPDNGARVAAVLRKMAEREPVGGGAASVLGRYEPSFVASQAQKWGDAQADWIDEAGRSLALFRRDAILPFLRALQRLGTETRERLLRSVEQYVRRDDAIATTLARDEGLPPPTRPAPTSAECREAIGLG